MATTPSYTQVKSKFEKLLAKTTATHGADYFFFNATTGDIFIGSWQQSLPEDISEIGYINSEKEKLLESFDKCWFASNNPSCIYRAVHNPSSLSALLKNMLKRIEALEKSMSHREANEADIYGCINELYNYHGGY